MDQSSDYHGLRMDQLSSFTGEHPASLTYHHQGWPTKLDQAATMHSMMSLCRVDFPPFKMQTTLPNQMYGHASFEGILELRKEKSRDAARSRRGKENYEYYELAKMLPLPQAITSQLDKASIIRLTIAFLKLKDFSCHGDPPWQREQCPPINKAVSKGHNRRRSAIAVDMFETHHGTHILQSLDGFAFALSNDGRFLYISETVSIYLGLSQVEMTGSSMFDYVHIQDHQELAEQLALNNPGTPCTSSSTSATLASSSSNTDQDQDSTSSSRAVTPTAPERTSIMTPNMSKGYERSFCIRMKSTLTKRGVHVKCSGYRVVQILAQMRPQFSFSMARKHPPPIMGLVGMVIALPPPTITELLIDNDMFVSRLSPELNLTYVEPKISEMMDICADDLTGESLYNHCHAEDLQKLRKAHIDLLSKGQVLTDYYRLMNKHGGFVWLQTCATIVYNSKNQDEQNIIGINYVLSGVEYPGCVMDMNQLSTLPNHHHDHSDHSESEHGSDRNLPHDGHHTPSPSQDYGHQGSNSRRGGFVRGHKRKHSAGQDDCSRSVTQLLEFGSLSPPPPPPQNGFQMMYSHDGSDVDTNINSLYSEDGTLLGDDKHLKHDFKNSRRKMDKPRKRKKDLEDLELGQSSNSGNIDLLHGNSSVPGNLVDLHSEIASLEDTVVTQASRPDSVHSLPTSPNTGIDPSLNPQSSQQTLNPVTNNTSTPIPEDLRVSSPTTNIGASTSPPIGGVAVVNNTSSTPLTYINGGSDKWPPPASIVTTSSSSPPIYPTEVSANTTNSSSSVRDLEEVMNKHLPITPGEAEHLRSEYAQSLLGLQKHHKSAIQWVGPAVPTTNDLTATNLLRSLYANRETVIRSNVYNPRPQYYSEVQSSLLTPPGATTDPYKDTFSVPKTTPPSTYSNLHYTPNSLSVSMTTGMNDSYSMTTPPSSVSPQEKYASVYGDHQLPPHYENGGSGVSMPIKPQAYPLPAHNNAHLSGYERASPYAATAAYYSPAYAHTTHYRDPTKNAMW